MKKKLIFFKAILSLSAMENWMFQLLLPYICSDFGSLRAMFTCKSWLQGIRQYMINEGQKVKTISFGDLSESDQSIAAFLLQFVRKGILPNGLIHSVKHKKSINWSSGEDYIQITKHVISTYAFGKKTVEEKYKVIKYVD